MRAKLVLMALTMVKLLAQSFDYDIVTASCIVVFSSPYSSIFR